MTGRTSWWSKDAAWHRRERQVELAEEFGPAGLVVLDILSAWSQEQDAIGQSVKGGFRSLAREAFTEIETVRAIVAFAVGNGALDDLVIADDGRLFTVRVSGLAADSERAKKETDRANAAARQAAKRERDRVAVTESDERDPSPGVTESHGASPEVTLNQTIQDKELLLVEHPLDRAHSTPSDVSRVFEAWVAATERQAAKTKLTPDRRRRIEKALRSHGLEDCLQAVGNIGLDPWARGANDRGHRFDDIEHALGNSKRIEGWRDWTPAAAGSNGGPGRRAASSFEAWAARNPDLVVETEGEAA